MADEPFPVVIDLGSGVVKGGFAGSDAPDTVFPTIVGTPKYINNLKLVGVGHKDKYIGNDGYSKRGVCKLSYPIENGIIKEWDDIESVLDYTFNELRADPSQQPLELSHSLLSPTYQLARICQLTFERFEVPAMCSSIDSVLSLFSSGRLTGLSLCSGHGVTSTLPCYEGRPFISGVKRMDLAGDNITKHLQTLLTERGYNLSNSNEYQTIQELKENHCFVSQDYNNDNIAVEKGVSEMKQYQLPDGQMIHIGSELYRAPEILFNPSLAGFNFKGIHELVYNSIVNTDLDVRSYFYTNLIVTGGTTMLNGFSTRLHRELTTLSPKDIKIRIISTPERKYSTWIGGSIIASISSFSQIWISREVYDEYGPNIVKKKITNY